MDFDFQLSEMHFSVLREIGNIGAGNAATSLSGLLGRKIDMNVPKVQILTLQQTSEALGGAELPVAAVLVSLKSDNVNGIMMFVVELDRTNGLVSALIGGASDQMGELEQSALQEIGSILTASYLGALSSFLDVKIDRSVPALAIDMAGAILSLPAIEFAKISDSTLFIESVFESDEGDVSGYFILVPDQESFKFIFSKLGLQ